MSKSLFLTCSAILVLFFTCASFYRLDRFSLWQDEAETALLAKSILQNGLPLAKFDNKWVTQLEGAEESNTNHLWHITPWLPFYLCALSFKIFGFSDFAARFPFALIGVFTAILLLWVTYRWTKDRAVSLLTLFFYVTNLTIIIYTRQCKYCTVYIFGFLLILYGMLLWKEKKGGLVLSVLGLTLLLQTNYLSAAFAVAGLGLYALFVKEGHTFRPLFLKALFWAALLFLPYFILGSVQERSSVLKLPSLLTYLTKLGTHLYYWNGQIFPLLLVLFFLWKRPPYFKFFLSVILASFFLLPFTSKDVWRYNLHLTPLFFILLGFIFVTLFRYKKNLGILLFALFFATNLFQNLPDAVHKKSLRVLWKKEDWVALKNYYFKNYVDPMKVISQRVGSHSKGKEYVYLNHDQLVWQWYSDIPFAYLADPAKVKPRRSPLEAHWTDKSKIDWWIGPHFVRMTHSFFVSEEEIIKEWKKAGFSYETFDTGIPILNWDLNLPIRYKHFIDKFSNEPSLKETIRLVHKIQ